MLHDTLLDWQSKRSNSVEKGKEMKMTRMGCKQSQSIMDGLQ